MNILIAIALQIVLFVIPSFPHPQKLDRVLVYGDGFVFGVKEPDGWHGDTDSAFNPSTQIDFSLPQQSIVQLKVYNTLGQVVATLVNGSLPASVHSVTFDARNLASGLYIYRLSAGNFTSVKKMMLLK